MLLPLLKVLKSAKADRERPHCLKACDSRITMTSLFLAGLAAELGEVDDGPLKEALALGGLEALRAIRTLPDKYLDRCSRCLGLWTRPVFLAGVPGAVSRDRILAPSSACRVARRSVRRVTRKSTIVTITPLATS